MIPDKTAGYDEYLHAYLGDELRVLNAHLPRERKSLATLVGERHPHLVCRDGSVQSFKRKELQHLVEILSSNEQEALLLPILIEYAPETGKGQVLMAGDVEAKVVSAVLGTVVAREKSKITILDYQLSTLRRVLRTTTQYVLSVNP